MVKAFRHLGNADLIFGNGKVSMVPNLVTSDGPVLVLTGNHFPHTQAWKNLEDGFRNCGIHVVRETVSGEPSPEIVDALVETARKNGTVSVVAIGGGSVLDAGKAAAAMLRHEAVSYTHLTLPTSDLV